MIERDARIDFGDDHNDPVSKLSKRHTRGNIRSLKAVMAYIKADLHRYSDSRFKFVRHFMFTPGFQYTVFMRLTGWAVTSVPLKYSIAILLKLLLSRCRYKYGIAIPEYTDIGPGFFINRFGGIYINGDAVIGANCNIAQMTIIGQVNRGDKAGSPTLGAGCSVAAGACIIGSIKIGDNSIIGNNAVVTNSMPENAVIGGVPARQISSKGSNGYINRMVSDAAVENCRSLADAARKKTR